MPTTCDKCTLDMSVNWCLQRWCLQRCKHHQTSCQLSSQDTSNTMVWHRCAGIISTFPNEWSKTYRYLKLHSPFSSWPTPKGCNFCVALLYRVHWPWRWLKSPHVHGNYAHTHNTVQVVWTCMFMKWLAMDVCKRTGDVKDGAICFCCLVCCIVLVLNLLERLFEYRDLGTNLFFQSTFMEQVCQIVAVILCNVINIGHPYGP